ncbi:hypothetical protein [Castellaniella sp. UC4442_H9]
MDQQLSEAQALAKIRALRARGIIGQLRPLLPAIDEGIRTGVPRAEIVKVLQSLGLPVSLKFLENALYRWRKRQGAPRGQPWTAASCPPSPVSPPASPWAAPSDSQPALQPPPSSEAAAVQNKGDLVRLRKSRSPDLIALAQLGKQPLNGRNS